MELRPSLPNRPLLLVLLLVAAPAATLLGFASAIQLREPPARPNLQDWPAEWP